jgi:1-hydroxycarotenoid 3,4-desaturase
MGFCVEGGRDVPTNRVVVIGAGIGGLVAALQLATSGLDVVLVERASAPGGKMREVEVAGRKLDAGPTVFTMRWVFEEIFRAAGSALDRHLTLDPVEILARHAWPDGSRLDLYADAERSADAIGRFAGAAEAARFRAFTDRARRIYETLETPFLRTQRPDPLSLVRRAGVAGLGGLWSGAPFSTLWHELGGYFHDPRLRQLFGRYATYCGSSPFQAPAMLMLVAHVEQQGVWLVRGGMHRLAQALAELCLRHGVRFRYATAATEVIVAGGRATGVNLAGGERLEADFLVVNADPAALPAGLLGQAVKSAVPAQKRQERSLSAVTWALVACAEGFPLIRHNVFFSADYAAEFTDIFGRAALPAAPTVYVCAQDRGGTEPAAAGAGEPERLFCLVNAPPTGDSHPFNRAEIEQCEKRSFAVLERCGLRLDRESGPSLATTPKDFEHLFPGTGGALYGQASHGWQASFRRPGSRTRIKGLYLAGGGTHPGPGVPMAALSGRLAAASVLEDCASTVPSRRAAITGGTSTRSATTGSKG